MKHTQVFRKLGALVLTLAVLVPSVIGVTAVDLPDKSEVGVDNTRARLLSINPKDKSPQTPDDSQLNFAQSTTADGWDNATGERAFTVTKLMPATLGGKIIPSDSSTYTQSTTSTPVIVKSTLESNKIDISLPAPKEVQAAIDASGTLPTISASASIYNGASWVTTPEAVQDALAKCFYGTNLNEIEDGYYSVEEYNGVNPVAWATVVGIPTFKATRVDTVEEDINYQVYVYPKMALQSSHQFDSYVDIINLNRSTSAVSTTNTARLAQPSSVWETASVSVSTAHALTQTFVLNGDLTQFNSPSNRLVMGASTTGNATITGVRSTPATYTGNASFDTYYPLIAEGYLEGNSVFSTNSIGEVGLMLEDISDVSKTVYIPLQSVATANGTGSLLTAGSPLSYYMGSANAGAALGTGSVGTFYQITDDASKSGRSYNFDFSVLNTALKGMVKDILAGTTSHFNLGSAPNISNYIGAYPATDDGVASAISAGSSIRFRLTASFSIVPYGNEFKTSDTFSSKEYTVGATIASKVAKGAPANTTPTPPTVNAQDFFNFGVTPTSGAYNGVTFTKNAYKEANVTTGALNLKKTDNYNSPLEGAKFAVHRLSDGKYATAFAPGTYSYTGEVPDGGYTWSTVASPTTANTYVVTSDVNGKVSFDGLAVDGEDYELVEVAAPKGFKSLQVTDSPQLIAEKSSWSEHDTAGGIAKVVNVPLLALPNTGGRGLAVLIALSLTGITVGYFLIRKKETTN